MKCKKGTNQQVFHVAGGELRAGGDLYWEYLEDFEAACDLLLASRKSRLVLDLTQVNFISSSFVGCLGNMMLKASRLKKRITLRVTLDISWLFEIMGGQSALDMEIV